MKRIVWALLIIIVIIQLVPFERPVVTDKNPDDLLLNAEMPDAVANKLKTACYDCHSNQTKYPWYSHVAPVSWLVLHDVKEGREALNFSNWGHLKTADKAKYLEDIMDEVSDGSMPIKPYTIIHPEAKLNENDKQLVTDWAEAYGESLFE